MHARDNYQSRRAEGATLVATETVAGDNQDLEEEMEEDDGEKGDEGIETFTASVQPRAVTVPAHLISRSQKESTQRCDISTQEVGLHQIENNSNVSVRPLTSANDKRVTPVAAAVVTPYCGITTGREDRPDEGISLTHPTEVKSQQIQRRSFDTVDMTPSMFVTTQALSEVNERHFYLERERTRQQLLRSAPAENSPTPPRADTPGIPVTGRTLVVDKQNVGQLGRVDEIPSGYLGTDTELTKSRKSEQQQQTAKLTAAVAVEIIPMSSNKPLVAHAHMSLMTANAVSAAMEQMPSSLREQLTEGISSQTTMPKLLEIIPTDSVPSAPILKRNSIQDVQPPGVSLTTPSVSMYAAVIAPPDSAASSTDIERSNVGIIGPADSGSIVQLAADTHVIVTLVTPHVSQVNIEANNIHKEKTPVEALELQVAGDLVLIPPTASQTAISAPASDDYDKREEAIWKQPVCSKIDTDDVTTAVTLLPNANLLHSQVTPILSCSALGLVQESSFVCGQGHSSRRDVEEVGLAMRPELPLKTTQSVSQAIQRGEHQQQQGEDQEMQVKAAGGMAENVIPDALASNAYDLTSVSATQNARSQHSRDNAKNVLDMSPSKDLNVPLSWSSRVTAALSQTSAAAVNAKTATASAAGSQSQIEYLQFTEVAQGSKSDIKSIKSSTHAAAAEDQTLVVVLPKTKRQQQQLRQTTISSKQTSKSTQPVDVTDDFVLTSVARKLQEASKLASDHDHNQKAGFTRSRNVFTSSKFVRYIDATSTSFRRRLEPIHRPDKDISQKLGKM